MSDEPRQYWVRNDKGKTWGPLTFATIELLVSNALIPGRLQASRDGINFVFPGRLPDLRDALPKELWGDSTEPLPDDSAPGNPAGPPVVGPSQSPTGIPKAFSRQATEPPVVAAPKPAAKSPAKSAPPPSSSDGLPASGELSTYSPFFLYYLAATGNETGKLCLKTAEVTYELFFKKGAPEAAASSRPEEDLGTFLVEQGALKPEQLSDARKVAPGFGGSVLNALFGMQLLNPADAFKHIGSHAVGLIVSALQQGEGSFSFERDAPMPPSAMPLGDRWAVACKAVRQMPADTVRERLGDRMEMPVMKSGGRVELEKLRLNAQEARAATSFDGVHTLEELCDGVQGGPETLLRTAFLMASFEMLSFSEAGRRSKPKSASAASPRPAETAAAVPPPLTPAEPAAAAPTSARSAEPAAATPPRPVAPAPAAPRPGPQTPPPGAPKLGNPTGVPPRPAAPARTPPKIQAAKPTAKAETQAPAAKADEPAALRALLEALKLKNHFQVLDIPENATAAQAKTAFFKLAKTYHPDTVPADAPVEIGKLKADIFAAINEAYRVLADDKLRASYVEELKAGSPEAVDASRIFAAEESFQKGCILVKARKFQEAVAMLGEAVKLNDKEGEFYAWRGWAAFLAARDKNAAKATALQDLETAIKLNPKCAQSYYFAGQISKLSGDAAGALKWFKKTLTVDSNHVDAQREVRMASANQKPK